MSLQRRHFLAGTAAGLAAAPSLAASSVERVEITPELIAAAQREGRLVVRYSSPVDEMATMAQGFEARFGIKVQMDRRVGVVATQLFATEERAGQHVMDVNFGSDPPGLRELAEEGFYQRYTLPDIETKIDAAARMDGLAYSPRWTDIVVAYNPEKLPHVRARALLSTWNGLLDPELTGKIGMTEPAGGGVAFGTYLMFYRLPQYGKAYVQKLAAQKPRLYPGSAQGREDLAAGAISVFLPDWESAVFDGLLKGSRTAWCYPDRLPGFANTYLAFSARAPHPAASRLFCAWFFTPEGARIIQKAQSRPTLNGVVDERTGLAAAKASDWWQPYPTERRFVPDPKDWDENYDTLMPEMRKLLGWTR